MKISPDLKTIVFKSGIQLTHDIHNDKYSDIKRLWNVCLLIFHWFSNFSLRQMLRLVKDFIWFWFWIKRPLQFKNLIKIAYTSPLKPITYVAITINKCKMLLIMCDNSLVARNGSMKSGFILKMVSLFCQIV